MKIFFCFEKCLHAWVIYFKYSALSAESAWAQFYHFSKTLLEFPKETIISGLMHVGDLVDFTTVAQWQQMW